MAYSEDKKPLGLSTLTTLATDDTFIVGDTSDTSEVVKSITKANLITDLEASLSIGISDGNKGDITVSGSGTTWTINDAAVQVNDLDATGTPSASTFLRGDGAWATPAGSGDVVKVGTPVNNQVGVWTGDGTLEGDTALTFDTATDTLTVGGEVVTPEIQAASSAGLAIRSNSGSLVADFGAGGGQNATFEDGTTVKGLFTVGSGAANGTIQSNGNYDLILQTGNATTGNITITDGAGGNITVTPDGTGNVVLATDDVEVGEGSQLISLISNASYVQVYGADASSGSFFDLSADQSGTYLQLADTNAGATGPSIYLDHESASPAIADSVGNIFFRGNDSLGGAATYGQLRVETTNVTSGAEAGKFIFSPGVSGSYTDKLEIDGTAVYPTTNDTMALGNSSKAFSDIYLATGANILVNNANAKRSLVLTASGGNPTTTSGCASPTKVEAGTNDVDYFVLDFDATSNEYAFWNVVMPDNYDGGTITATFYWTSAAGSAGNVIWGLQGRSYANDAAIDQAWGTAQEVTDAWIANGDVHITSATAAITLGGTPAGGEYVALRAYRNAASGSDTLSGDARLLSIKVEYGINAYSE